MNDMEEFNMENYDFELKRPRRGDTVVGEVVSMEGDRTIYINLNSFTEGTMYLEYYTKDPNITSFKGIVKIGDKITCTVSKVTEDNIYLSRLNQINEEGFNKLVEAKEKGEVITVKVTEKVDEKGFVITRERPYGMTTRAGVFSSGDVVHGPATVVLAMKESKKVAEGIAQYVDAKRLMNECGL